MNDFLRFEKISSFLHKYEDIWRYEILETYPQHLRPYPKSWLDELREKSDEELYHIDINCQSHSVKNSEFKEYLNTIKEYSDIEYIKIPAQRDYPSWAFFKVKEKKVHEIQVIVDQIHSLKEKTNFNKIVDIGGGVGHLSRTLAHYHSIPCTSLDIDEHFQEIGKKRLEKFPLPKGADEVKFINHDFSKDFEQNLNKKIFSRDSFSIGLHTCGPLAKHHLNIHLQEDTCGILNFGCCYNRLDPLTDVNLSQKAKKSPINYTPYALTLAARGHDSMDFEAFKFKRTVKLFRYGLHIFLKEVLNRDDIYAVGDSHKRYYSNGFSSYIIHKLDELKIDHQISTSEIDNYFESRREFLLDMFYANIIRWQLGRLLELHILLDRVIYLNENGQEATLKRYFHSHLSPRNLGILSIKKS